MLEDRHYMRQPWFRGPGSATVVLLVVNVVAFVLQNLVYRFSSFPVNACFALSVEGLRHGFVWQLLTYQFMHGGWLHLLLNCWAIYVFGRAIEETLGWKSFLTLYFSSGVAGGLFQAMFGVLLHGVYAAPVVGASAGAFGLVAAFATLYPERPLTLLLFFVIPLSMRAKFLLLFSALLAVLGILVPTDNIAHAAHLGGMIAGVVFVRHAVHWHWRLPRLRPPRPHPPRLLVKARHPRQPTVCEASPRVADEDLPPEEFLSKAVDPILDKISAHGIQSLTERERRILETARERMVKR
ncbi:MAG TPA: rhomboid family intramembrane serine protease [Verrucomicrobiota bacterium]|jgi:membrane associated rhomboid family serine protease|nr:rhomboid family intramembrane serine protease [Verrucomicrobiota bacterium]HQL78383.1 rhomboid family intramembrane serine protease [Verrucomicrobiota bacterium]